MMMLAKEQDQEYYWLTRLMRHPAPIIIVGGKPDSGKTDFALHMAERSLERKMIDEVGTNIKVFDDRFLRISSVKGLETWFFFSKLRKLFLFDEASSHIDRRNPLSKINKGMRHVGFKVRKGHGKIIIITQRFKDVESTFDDPDLTVCKIKKLSRTTALLKSPLFPEILNITDIPATIIKFDTYDIAPFTLEEEVEGSDKVLGRSLCCQIASMYANIGNLSTIGNLVVEKGLSEKPLKAMQVKRLLQEHIQHTL